jgi:hypothetical protein
VAASGGPVISPPTVEEVSTDSRDSIDRLATNLTLRQHEADPSFASIDSELLLIGNREA